MTPYAPPALVGSSMSSERGVRIGTIYVAPRHKELKFWSDTAVPVRTKRQWDWGIFEVCLPPEKRQFFKPLSCALWLFLTTFGNFFKITHKVMWLLENATSNFFSPIVVSRRWDDFSSQPFSTTRFLLLKKERTAAVSISSGHRNLMKTYHNEANTGEITKKSF